MQSVGSETVLTDSTGLRAYLAAEQNLARYIAEPSEALYDTASSGIASLPSAGARAALQKALDDARAQSTEPAATTPAQTQAQALAFRTHA